MKNEPAGRKRAESLSGRAFMRERFWLFISIELLATGGLLLLLGSPSAAFVLAALGVCAWFFDIRMGLKRKHDLVKLSGRNWVPRAELEKLEDDEEE